MNTRAIPKVPVDRSLLELVDTPLWRKYYELVRCRVRFPRRFKRTVSG